MCMVDGSDDWTVLAEGWRRAQKVHRCFDCSRQIDPGERYHYTKAIECGYNPETFKLCAQCWAASEWLTVTCHGFLFGGILDDLENHWDECMPPIRSLGLGRLIVGMRRRWRTEAGHLVTPERVAEWARSATRTHELGVPA